MVTTTEAGSWFGFVKGLSSPAFIFCRHPCFCSRCLWSEDNTRSPKPRLSWLHRSRSRDLVGWSCNSELGRTARSVTVSLRAWTVQGERRSADQSVNERLICNAQVSCLCLWSPLPVPGVNNIHGHDVPSGGAGATLLKPGESAGMPGVIITGEKNKMISQGLTLRNFRLTHHLACADG